jgi:hypothetical protein
MMTTLEEDAQRFAAFIVANYPDAKEWADPVGKAAWYINYGFIAAVYNEEGDIVALVAVRPVERPGIGVLPYYFNENGRCLHCDLLIDTSDDTRALMVLKLFCQLRFPQCTTVAMFRHYETNIRVYSLDKFWPSFEKIKKIRKRKKKEQQHESATAI